MVNVELLKERLNDALFDIEDLKEELSAKKMEIDDLKDALAESDEIINSYEEKLKFYEEKLILTNKTKCHFCSSPMIWNNDFSYEDFGIYESDGIVAVLTCSNCNTQAEFYYSMEENNG